MNLYSEVIKIQNNATTYHKNYILDDKWYYQEDDGPIREIDKTRLCPIFKSNYTKFSGDNNNNKFIKHYLRSFTGYEDSITNLVNEIEAYEKINLAGGHKNVCKYYGCIESQSLVNGIVLEKYSQNLFDVKSLSNFHKVKIIRCIISGTEFLHNIGIINGDINPYNIMLDNNMDAVIIDFDSTGIDNCKAGTEDYMKNEYRKNQDNDFYSVLKTIQYVCQKPDC